MENQERIYKNENIVCRGIHDKCYLIDITQNYLDNRCLLYELNETGRFIWEQLDHADHAEAVVQELLRVIVSDVDENVIRDDVGEYLDLLEKEGFISYGRDE